MARHGVNSPFSRRPSGTRRHTRLRLLMFGARTAYPRAAANQLSILLYIWRGTSFPWGTYASGWGPYCVGELLMIDRNYLARRAALLLNLARTTADRALAATLIDKAADLKARIDASSPPEVTPLAPDIERSRAS